MLHFFQKAPLILELFINGCFILLYSLHRYDKIPWDVTPQTIEFFLYWGARVVPFIIGMSVVAAYLHVRSIEAFFRKYVFSLMVFVPLLITWGDIEFCFWLSSVHLLSSLLTLYEDDEEEGLFKRNPSTLLLRVFKLNPPQLVLLTFAALIIFGTLLLMLPFSSASHKTLHLIDALFMITSAACVTGLATVSVGNDLSLFGQLVLLATVQVGGLGIMILYASMSLFLGRAMPMKERLVMQGLLEVSSMEDLMDMIFDIIKYTVVIELWGTIILTIGFYNEGYDFLRSLYFAIFHSVSAFCNAGFSLLDTNLETFATNPIIHGTIALLITMGGLGFIVLRELKMVILRHKKMRDLTLHSKIVLSTSAVLTFGGALFIFFGEFLNALDQYTLWEKIQISLFQSVTLRTAGFDTIPMLSLSNYTIYIMIILMFIGASPGSTGGGIKTTTFAILMQSVRAILRGKDEVEIFDRTIPNSTVVRSTALSILSFILVVVVLFALMRTEPDKPFLSLIFEVVSAFGTVGLSIGVSPYLSVMGKLIIILTMYIGRVGPLTLLVAVGQKELSAGSRKFPEGRVMIG